MNSSNVYDFTPNSFQTSMPSQGSIQRERHWAWHDQVEFRNIPRYRTQNGTIHDLRPTDQVCVPRPHYSSSANTIEMVRRQGQGDAHHGMEVTLANDAWGPRRMKQVGIELVLVCWIVFYMFRLFVILHPHRYVSNNGELVMKFD